METLDEIILKLKKYAIEYEDSGNIKFANASKAIVEYLKVGDYKNAITLFRTSELLYDLGNTYDALKKLDIEDYVSKNFDINWGLKAGEYIAWRSGNIENTKNGIFFSISQGGAEAYSNNERTAKKYTVKINKPLVARRAEHAYLILTGKNVPKTLTQSGGNDDWWVKLDERIVSLAKAKGYDSVTYTMPAPPAMKELILFDKKQVIESFKNGGLIHKQKGIAKKLNITPTIKEHDMIAECGDCGNKFSYQNSKNHILWECPECKSIKRIS